MAADVLEDLCGFALGNQQPQHPGGAGGCRGRRTQERARARPPLDQALGLEVPQGTGHRRTGYPVALGQLDLGRELPGHGIRARCDLRSQVARNVLMLRHGER